MSEPRHDYTEDDDLEPGERRFNVSGEACVRVEACVIARSEDEALRYARETSDSLWSVGGRCFEMARVRNNELNVTDLAVSEVVGD